MEADMDYVKRLGAVITNYRQEQKRTKSELASAAGIDRTYLGRIEQGAIANVSVTVIRNIADGLGISFVQLMATAENYSDKETKDGEEPYGYIDGNLNAALYPPYNKNFPATSMFDFLMYLPLIDDRQLAEMLCRIDGNYKNALYVLEKISDCVESIPQGLAKEYADIMVKSEYEGTLEDISKQREQYSKVLETRKGLADCRSQYVNMIKYNEQLTNKK